MDTPDYDRNELGNSALGGHGPTRANAGPGGEDWLHSVLENSSEIVTVVDPDGTLRYASPAFGRVFGYDPGEAVNTMNVLDHVHPDDLPHVLAESEGALSEDGAVTNRAEYRFRHADGSWRWVESVGTYLPNDPQVEGVVMTVRDVTGRKEAEEALRESEAEVFSVLESITDAFFSLDREWRFVYINPRAQDLFSNPREDLLGEKIWEDPTFFPEYRRAVAEGRTVEFEALYPPRGLWYSVRAYPSASGLSVYLQDVTERKRAEEALKESEERFRRQSRELGLLHRVRSAVAREVDAQGVLYGAVEAVAEAYGYTRVSAYLLQGEELLLQHQVGYGEVIERIPLKEGVSGRAVRAGRAVLVEDVSADPDFLGVVEGVTSEVCVPLFDDGGAVGFLNVEGTGRVKLGQDDLKLMVAVGEHVGVAVGRARLHDRVRRSEERFRALTQHSSDLVTLLGATGAILYQSPAVERVLGYSSDELLGKNAFDHVHPDDLQRVEMAFVEGLKDPRRRPSVEFRFRHKEGSWRWLESAGTNLIGESAVGAYVINSRDVTERKEADKRLREAEERYRTLVERIPAVTYIDPVDAPDESLYTSPQIEGMLGYTPEEWRTDKLWPKRLHPDDRERVLAADERFEAGGEEQFSEEYRLVAKDGSVVWVREDAVLVKDGEGKPLYWQGVFYDLTERKEAERTLGESEKRFRSSFDDAAVGMALVGLDGRWLRVNRSLCEIFGYPQGELLEKSFQDITHPADLQRDLEHLRRLVAGDVRTYQMEKRYLHKEGHVVWALLSVSLVRDDGGEPLYFVSQVQDIGERKRMEGQLKRQAFHDSLTGLPNRKLFMDRLWQALGRTWRRSGSKVAVLFMDLDGFKVINDSLGHEAGDLLLTVVAQRLRRCLRPEDTLARFGGDEFVVLLGDVGDPQEAVRVAERITEELRRPFVLEGRSLFASASIGIGLGDARTKTTDDLLRDADTAMYRAKEAGGGYSVFDPTMYERAIKRLELENDLRRAIERGEFVVHYQPIVRLGDRKIWGVEALVRWEHPERGLLNPDEFVPVAEESGLVVPMGVAVMEEACLRAKGWQEAHPQIPPLVMSVNLSARQLARSDLAETVDDVLGRTGFEGSCLALDVTETVYVKSLEGNTGALDRLRGAGVKVSIDDFGTGYSSLSYLKRLPADAVKIDKSFVGGLGEDVEDTAIVRMIVELAHTLGMEVVAEGVETEEQAALLKEMGCDFGQGFYFSKPLPPEDVPEFLTG